MTPEGTELIVRDLGSTNGIRINGERVDEGRLRVGDELSIAHIRFRLDNGYGEERTVAATMGGSIGGRNGIAQHERRNGTYHHAPAALPLPAYPPQPGAFGPQPPPVGHPPRPATTDDLSPPDLPAMADLPPELADQDRIQVVFKMAPGEPRPSPQPAEAHSWPPDSPR